MFYRKYRPQKFSELSKPNDVAKALANEIVADKISHAYLFIGPRGTGKTTIARLFTKAINCKKPSSDGDPCAKCESCEAIKNGKFIDLIEIDAASNRGIDDIRSLKEKVHLSPMSSKYKVYIIDEVHMLTMEAFNALLKTLEEPPKHVVFILCTTEGHKVPDTIKSRCQVFKFKRATIKQIVERLEEIAKKEKVKVKKEDLEKIAYASFGGFRDADTLLQQIIEGSISADSLLGVSALESFMNLTDFLILGKTQASLELVNKIFDEGVDLTNWCNEYIRYLRDLLYIQAGFNSRVNDVTNEIFARMEEQAFKLSPIDLVTAIERFLKSSNEIKTVSIAQLPLELAVVDISERGVGLKDPDLDEDEQGGNSKRRKGDSSKESEESSGKSSKESSIAFDTVSEKWAEVLKDIKPYNHSVEALLRSCKPSALKENTLILEVSYAFHKERLEAPKSREILERVLKEKFGVPIKVKCVLKSREGESLTDKNIEEPKDKKIAKTAIEVFDGAVEV